MLRFLFSKTFILQLILAGIFIALVILGTYFFLINYAKTGEAVTVPNLEGYDLVEAEAELTQLDLEIEVIDSIFHLGQQGGIIMEQQPREGSMVKKNRKIYLTISRYETPTVKVPNVLNQTSAIAISKLNRRGFIIGKLTSKTDPCDGCAIGIELNGKTIQPETNIPVGSKIDLIIGQLNEGANSVVPTLYGLTKDEATQVLHNFELNRGAYNFDETVETGGDSLAARVFYQSEKSGESIKLGSPINITLTLDITKLPNVNLDSIKASI